MDLEGLRAELRTLEHCVSNLKSFSEWSHRTIPTDIYSLDRRLHQMSFGVEALEVNLAHLRRRALQIEVGLQDRHLIANAIEGCRAYDANFRSRLRLFLWFMGCLAALISILTLRAIYSMLPPRKRIYASPADKTVSASSSGDPHKSHLRRP